MDKITLYSLATPNGQKISIALEEMDLPYTAITLNIMKGEQFTPEFIKVNPNSKIPAIVDPQGPTGEAFCVMESGAILVYLAEKTGKFLSQDPFVRSETMQWLFFQMGGIGPMFGQFGHFYKYAGEKCTHPYPVERYSNEARRLLGVLENRLDGRTFLVNEEYTIADMSIVPWVSCLDWGYKAKDHLKLSEFPRVNAWVERVLSRPKTARGMKVCPFQ